MNRLWHLAWSFSLLLAAVVAAVWIACGWCSYVYQRDVGGWLDRAVYVEQGQFYLLWAQRGASSQLQMPVRHGWLPEERGRWWGDAATPAREPKWSLLGVSFAPATRPGDLNWLVAPLAWPMLLLLVLPMAQVVRWLRVVRRRRRGRCVHCGYDLRGTSGDCPECGEPGEAIVTESMPGPV